MDLTPREQEVYDLRNGDPPLSYQKIADDLGIEKKSVIRSIQSAEQKLANPGYEPTGRQKTTNIGRRVEDTKPDEFAAFVDSITDPDMQNVAEAARESGLPVSATARLIERLNGQYQPVVREIERIKTNEFVVTAEKLAMRFWNSITDDDIDNLDAYKRVIAGAILVDKRELLDGRPTERISIEDRRLLPEMIGRLMKEAERRGMMKEINPETGTAHLTTREQAPYMVQAGRAPMPEEIDVEP